MAATSCSVGTRATSTPCVVPRCPPGDAPYSAPWGARYRTSRPAGRKIRDGVVKQVFRSAIRGLVPPAVLDHPKLGFAVPVGAWFRGPLRHRLDRLSATDGGLYDVLDRASVRRLVREHLMRRRDHSTALWRALVLQLWLDHLGAGRLARARSKRLCELRSVVAC